MKMSRGHMAAAADAVKMSWGHMAAADDAVKMSRGHRAAAADAGKMLLRLPGTRGQRDTPPIHSHHMPLKGFHRTTALL